VTSAEFAEQFIGTAIQAYKSVDIIVNNAGYTWDNVIQKMSDEQWHAIIDCHLTAPFRILRAAQPHIRDMARAEAAAGTSFHRKVVNVSSVSGTGGNAGQANYSAAKMGIVGLTKTLAKEWGRYLVNVNAVAFGLIKTRLTETSADSGARIDIEGRQIRVGINPDSARDIESRIPLGRGGTPDEAAGAIYLFCIPESNYVSGQVLTVGGGSAPG
jgi:3-oxoacyl-[acyl-carrier protein] reductase